MPVIIYILIGFVLIVWMGDCILCVIFNIMKGVWIWLDGCILFILVIWGCCVMREALRMILMRIALMGFAVFMRSFLSLIFRLLFFEIFCDTRS